MACAVLQHCGSERMQGHAGRARMHLTSHRANSAPGSTDGRLLALAASLYSLGLPKSQIKEKQLGVTFHFSSPPILLKIVNSFHFSIEIALLG